MSAFYNEKHQEASWSESEAQFYEGYYIYTHNNDYISVSRSWYLHMTVLSAALTTFPGCSWEPVNYQD